MGYFGTLERKAGASTFFSSSFGVNLFATAAPVAFFNANSGYCCCDLGSTIGGRLTTFFKPEAAASACS